MKFGFSSFFTRELCILSFAFGDRRYKLIELFTIASISFYITCHLNYLRIIPIAALTVPKCLTKLSSALEERGFYLY